MAGAVVELLPDGPDTLDIAERPVLRRTVADSVGRWRLPWLPADGDGWLLRAYDDGNRDRRIGENEATRLWPDTLRLTPAQPSLATGLRVVYQPRTPGTLAGRLDARPDSAGAVLAFVLAFAEEDTGYAPRPQPAGTTSQAVPDTGAFTLVEAGPGEVRAVFFVDMDGDSLLSAVGQPADTMWTLEPWALVDSLLVEPGLETVVPSPVWPDTLTAWPAPARADTAAADSLGAAMADSLAALVASLVDSLAATLDDSLSDAARDSLASALMDSLVALPGDTMATLPVDTLAVPPAPEDGP
jgi:hypothetical protein